MIPITVNTFTSEITTWMQNRLLSLPERSLPFYSSGGWEGWAQTEIAMHFAPTGYDVIREVQCYWTHDKADFVINNNCSSALYPKVAVELKCQSIYISGSQFSINVNSDHTKLQRYLQSGYRGLVIAFIVREETLADFRRSRYNIRAYSNFALAWISI